MLIKEYRIPLPLTVEEYRIAQLYMIAKKSREESKGAGSGVEILVNEPYEDGPGGRSGQYTHKLYHVGSHLPGWFKSLLPKSALTVKEEAWNAYPYTKTRYTCPFVEKFSLEIETYYFADNGHQENVFRLTGSDYRNRVVDVIDVVKDQLYGADYMKEEDPKIYQSNKTGRGPLNDSWLQDYWAECQGQTMPLSNGKSIMCAYKLCRVEFRYWGMQTKLEKFIHDVALRKTMLRAHRQAWAWQDEWHGLTMEDIRQIERQTQEALKKTMGVADETSLTGSGDDELDEIQGLEQTETSTIGIGTPGGDSSTDESTVAKTLQATLGSIEKPEDIPSPPPMKRSEIATGKLRIRKPRTSDGDNSAEESPSEISSHSGKTNFDLQVANWRMESIVRDSDSASDDEEFFDCQEDVGDSSSLAKWSSLDLLTEEDIEQNSCANLDKQDSIFSHTFLQRVLSERGRPTSHAPLTSGLATSMDISCPGSPIMHHYQQQSSTGGCGTSALLLVLHAGSVLDANVDLTAKKSDITTFRGAFESVMRQHYPTMVGHVAIRLVSCPSVCTEALGILSSLSPYSFDVSPSCTDTPHITHDSIPIGAIPLFACTSPEYREVIARVITNANNVYHEFLRSVEGRNFNGNVVFVGDGVGSILGYDALCRTQQIQSRHESENSLLDSALPGGEVIFTETPCNEMSSSHLQAPSPRRRSSSTSENPHHCKLDFEVSDFFMFGSPLALVLAYRKVAGAEDKNAPIPKPAVGQVYNLFHPTDPVAARLEPLLSARFSMLPPVNVARYQKYPLGNGQPYHLLEIIQTNPQMFAEGQPPFATPIRRLSEVSLQSTVSGVIESLPIQTINALTQKWWGMKRLDYALYCPEGLANFPTNALPHLFHASYWESSDVIAFILRQLGRFELMTTLAGDFDKGLTTFSPAQPREKWLKKRTYVKLKNVAPNHRANDVIVKEGAPQTLVARFIYGPLDMIALTGERIDIHVMRDAPGGEWIALSTEITDKTGRITYTIPEEKALGYGMYPIKMVVRGDHSSLDMFLVVVPPRTECVVFSIDGSFTASVSVTGKDPKVRAGAVDVVRHWQELGFMIIYITGRPDMQQHKVVSWLSQHNFPHGLVSFADGLSTDPLGHKAVYLKNLIQDHGVIVHAAYGSSKDISVYTAIGLKPKQIFIVGKVSKKHHSHATILADGYAAHLTLLLSHGGSRPAQGNARMVIPRGYFGLPGQSASFRRRSADSKPEGGDHGSAVSDPYLNPLRSAKRAISYPLMGGVGFKSSDKITTSYRPQRNPSKTSHAAKSTELL